MEEITKGDRHQVIFRSFAEYLDFHETHQDKNSFNGGFYGKGLSSLQDAVDLGRKGLTDKALDALEMATELLPALENNLIDQRFKPLPSVEGADVDVAVYLSGEPECMITYECVDQEMMQPIVTIVIATGILGHVSDTAIAERGARVMAMLNAIEMTGVQTEIWSDSSTRTRSSETMHGRISVKLKAAGEPFDASMLMYCMTHDSMHRTLGFNTKDHFPGRFARCMGRGAGYGSTVLGEMRHRDDYPEGAVYIEALRSDSDVFNVEDTLRKLGLMH